MCVCVWNHLHARQPRFLRYSSSHRRVYLVASLPDSVCAENSYEDITQLLHHYYDCYKAASLCMRRLRSLTQSLLKKKKTLMLECVLLRDVRNISLRPRSVFCHVL